MKRIMYYVRRNNALVIDTPFYDEAVKEYNDAIDRGKKGDRITISAELNESEFKLLAGVRL